MATCVRNCGYKRTTGTGTDTGIRAGVDIDLFMRYTVSSQWQTIYNTLQKKLIYWCKTPTGPDSVQLHTRVTRVYVQK